MAKYFVIEGVDCIGKSTFIRRFVEYVKRPIQPPDPREEVIYEPFSVIVATIAKATKENAEFYKKMHAGEIGYDEMAAQYLQVHYDHHMAALELGKTHDIVILDRGLPSYFALQLHTQGYAQHAENWMKVMELTNQNKMPLVYLHATPEVIRERASQKQGESVHDAFFSARLDKVMEGYQTLLDGDLYKDVLYVDATEVSFNAYVPHFEAMLDRTRYDDLGVLDALAASRGIAPKSLGNIINL